MLQDRNVGHQADVVDVEVLIVIRYLFLALSVFQFCAQKAGAHGAVEHVVVVVWDGMRPDFVTPQYTPTLYALAKRGTFFMKHHSLYVSTTEVNGTALATGMHPDHSGIIANTEYRQDVNWLSSYGTEALDVVRRGDLATGGHYLGAPTVAELMHASGWPTFIAGSKPIALLHDRSFKKTSPAEKNSVTLFRGQTLPRSALESLVNARDIGPVPLAPASPGFDAIGSQTRGRRGAAAGAWCRPRERKLRPAAERRPDISGLRLQGDRQAGGGQN